MEGMEASHLKGLKVLGQIHTPPQRLGNGDKEQKYTNPFYGCSVTETITNSLDIDFGYPYN